MLDLSRLTPEAQPIVEQAARVYLRHTTSWFVGLVTHGSALKGGFIRGCSDIDLQLYLDSSAFLDGYLPFEVCMAIQRDLAKTDPAPFSYIQCYPFSDKLRDDWVGPVPGAYAVLAGRLPVPEATREELRASAACRLSEMLAGEVGRYGNGLLDRGPGRIARHARLVCTSVWPTLNSVLVMQGHDPLHVWNVTKQEAMSLLPAASPLADAIGRFYQGLLAYYPAEDSFEGGLSVIKSGVGFLQAARAWWASSKADSLQLLPGGA